MSAEVIQMEGMRMRFKQRRYYKPEMDCAHNSISFDDNGEIVECDDCKKQLSAYWVLTTFAKRHQEATELLAREKHLFIEQSTQAVSLLAAQRVEKAWRSRTMVPMCPHCAEPIYPDDGFGGACMGRKFADHRRIACRARKAERPQP